jgi:hypothetical protein
MGKVIKIIILLLLLGMVSCSSHDNKANAKKYPQPLDARYITITIPIVQ